MTNHVELNNPDPEKVRFGQISSDNKVGETQGCSWKPIESKRRSS
jgi:hypothetical protein